MRTISLLQPRGIIDTRSASTECHVDVYDGWLWSAGVYSLSRLLFFPAMFARPDMLCGMFGRLALAEHLDEAFDGELVRTYGDRPDEFSCYAEVYRVP